MRPFEHNLHESRASALSQVTTWEPQHHTYDWTGISNGKVVSDF